MNLFDWMSPTEPVIVVYQSDWMPTSIYQCAGWWMPGATALSLPLRCMPMASSQTDRLSGAFKK